MRHRVCCERACVCFGAPTLTLRVYKQRHLVAKCADDDAMMLWYSHHSDVHLAVSLLAAGPAPLRHTSHMSGVRGGCATVPNIWHFATATKKGHFAAPATSHLRIRRKNRTM